MTDNESRRVRRFEAKFKSAKEAQVFSDNAARVADATGIARNGVRVQFNAPTLDSTGYVLYGDIQLSVSYYGGGRISQTVRSDS